MVSGRLTKYKPEYIQFVDEYLDSYFSHKQAFPSIVGLAFLLKVHETTIENWAREHEEFGEAIQRLRQKQHDVAWFNGMTGSYNPHLCKLLLNKHGYKEEKKTENEHKFTPLGDILNEIQE